MKNFELPHKIAGLLLLALLAQHNLAGAQLVQQEHWELRAMIELESAFGTSVTAFQKSELMATPELTADLPYGLRLRGSGRFRADLFDELEPGQPSQPELADLNKRTYIGDHLDVSLRELTVDFYAGPAFLKVGKQQIVWGKTDGLKLLDVVNPQNFRVFVLDEFEDSRIPLWSLLAEIPVGNLMVQALWIPDRTYHKLPAADGAFRFRAPGFTVNTPTGFAAVVNPIERPDDFIADSDLGARLSTFWKGWDLTLNYLYHYQDIPVVTRSIQFEPVQKVVIHQNYRRSHLAGFSFSNAFGDLTLRGEAAYSFDRYFRTDDPADRDGVIQANTLDYALGLDWFGFDEMLVSAQLFRNRTIHDETESLFRNKVDTRASLLIKRSFLNERLEMELLGVAGINQPDGFIQSKMIYEWKSNVNVWLGFDGLWGDRDDLIGQFNRQDRLLWGMEIGL